MPSILKLGNRKVLKFLKINGFKAINLRLLIMEDEKTLNEVIKLEQYFIDNLNSTLNVDRIAQGTGYHSPMSLEMRTKLKNLRGTSIYVYDKETLNLLYIFASKTEMYKDIKIHHKTLADCLSSGKLYLNSFFMSLDLIEETIETQGNESVSFVSLENLKSLVEEKRNSYRSLQPKALKIKAINILDDRLTKEFNSLNELAKYLKGDKQTIRSYLNLKGYDNLLTNKKLYRRRWEFISIDKI